MCTVEARVPRADRPADEAELVARCLAGEPAAERELFRRERGRVQASLYRVLGSNREMEDLVQETFLEVFRSLPRFRGEARLSTWIDRIAARVALRYLERKRRVPVPLAALPEIEDEDPQGAERVLAREGVRRLYGVLATLRPAARLALTLHLIEGLTVPEVARRVGASAIATKLRVWRARREVERQAAADPVLAEFLGRALTEEADEG
jgi:RNA polymerase sigma-70 factor, ECF subfamily